LIVARLAFVLSSLILGPCLGRAAATPPATPKLKRVEFVQTFHPAAKGKVELWIPTPLEAPGYQRLISRELTGNATVTRIGSEAGNAAPFIYARWDDVAEPTLKIVNVVEVQDRAGPLPARAEDATRYLAGSPHVQIDGIVKETAVKIVGDAKDPDAKARRIYDWIVEKTVRDPAVRGCGLGDVKTTLTSGSLKGKCADLNSLFVGLARAAGVPAREVFGQRVATSSYSKALGKDEDNSKAQHCRAEYLSAGGWVPVDPADVRKFILEENLAPDDPKVVALKDKFFGYWEGTWVAFNFARDFKLDGYDAERLNYFMYPLLAAAKIRPDGVEPQETGYAFHTAVLPD
jgi:transglutaminase-like putative cysteine protease